ncbi:sporulation initiation factor Spo0A C-terminal domain-containing protein [Pseudoflavonifractor phocaeensis]|uniref:sporulation initiation factor Spo0A C-terminal domain-containing protein n=1 Tax=Pseudoflavonifractor phocaeensis TaxID=1870988 RepID=UPI00308AA86B|nr:hypothetical protein CE91St43_20170 [Oscillospiraceae bacterium]
MDRRKLLRNLGITANYEGFHHCLAALEVINREPEALMQVTKRLYPAVAERYGITWKAVEIGLRRTVKRAWDSNPDFLRELNGRPLPDRPTVSQFLDILAANVD